MAQIEAIQVYTDVQDSSWARTCVGSIEGAEAMWELTVPWWEVVIRSTVLSLFTLLLIRLSNRGGGDLSATDLVLLITLGNIAASAALKSDDSVSAAIISMASFVSIGAVLNFFSSKSKSFDRLLEGSPRILIHNGKINEETCKNERLSKQDVMRAVRNGGCVSIASVHVAFVETNGKISIIAKQNRLDK
ncbi:MAG: hypothetical protein QG574_5566 [Cyanobacteriota bacterium erpe_2018_sw_21hr_WHONDRS-SW48-000092_B_bin.40]|nr:hypothetical protein [Cyanobacteriota bacterium erpe_2018_sw_21hr_WHONDRS-SW48-000092_B_bin.40]